MKNKNSILSFICFVLTGISSLLLFAGLFTTSWDYIIAHWEDTLFVLGLGTLVPILLILGVYFLIKGFRIREALIPLPIVIGILVFLSSLVFYSSLLPGVIGLYKIKIGQFLWGCI